MNGLRSLFCAIFRAVNTSKDWAESLALLRVQQRLGTTCVHACLRKSKNHICICKHCPEQNPNTPLKCTLGTAVGVKSCGRVTTQFVCVSSAKLRGLLRVLVRPSQRLFGFSMSTHLGIFPAGVILNLAEANCATHESLRVANGFLRAEFSKHPIDVGASG